ncbi:hypothetical protein [Alicyclobacillus sendaiensis]|uniref:Uncharacterized protein n=1 Tax=Alicyclobacillus sendaiensis PA2 TaxID=3029425 RepID=A0ABT6Y378_ALISE|nr:hypothetical protein [Alicyclobacillus sendaiensis]MDI9261319.1 hypothetical protein [Alicyclobacillus sendaiensis PA2]
MQKVVLFENGSQLPFFSMYFDKDTVVRRASVQSIREALESGALIVWAGDGKENWNIPGVVDVDTLKPNIPSFR